jgi:hypothetical protein
MKLYFNKSLDYFVLFIIFIKIVFAISAVGYVIISHSKNYGLQDKLDPKLLYWKQRTEFIFIASMSLLLMYHFFPGKNVPVNKESGLLFFLFGIILLVSANWNLFFTEPSWFKSISSNLK